MYAGRPSVKTSQCGMNSSKMCLSGRIPGSSSNTPAGIAMNSPLRWGFWHWTPAVRTERRLSGPQRGTGDRSHATRSSGICPQIRQRQSGAECPHQSGDRVPRRFDHQAVHGSRSFAICQQGRLALEDRLSKYIPNLPGADQVSIRLLLNHTSGIHDSGEQTLA